MFGPCGENFAVAGNFHAPVVLDYYRKGCVWTFVSAMVGGYVTATIAQRSVQRHLVALIGVGLVIGLLTLAVSVDGEPLWHPITNLVVMTLGVTFGGRLAAGRV